MDGWACLPAAYGWPGCWCMDPGLADTTIQDAGPRPWRFGSQASIRIRTSPTTTACSTAAVGRAAGSRDACFACWPTPSSRADPSSSPWTIRWNGGGAPRSQHAGFTATQPVLARSLRQGERSALALGHVAARDRLRRTCWGTVVHELGFEVSPHRGWTKHADKANSMGQLPIFAGRWQGRSTAAGPPVDVSPLAVRLVTTVVPSCCTNGFAIGQYVPIEWPELDDAVVADPHDLHHG